MSYQVFSKVLAQEKWVLDGWRSSFMFGGQSGFSRNLTHAPAGTFTLEREAWVHALPLERRESRSSVKCVYPEVCVFWSPLERGNPRSSEGLCHTLERGSSARRAWISCIQHFFISLQYARAGKSTLERSFIVCMSAWAWTLSSAKFEKWFSMHFCVLIPS